VTSKLPKSFDLVVVGAGITGLSTAYHLEKRGYRQVLVISSSEIPDMTRSGAGLVAPGLVDNFTRLSHQMGLASAREVWQAGDMAFQHLRDFCQNNGLPSVWGKRLRLATSDAEATEVSQAVDQMQSLGLKANSYEPQDEVAKRLSLGSRVRRIQEEVHGGGWLDTTALCQKLRETTVYFVEDHVLAIQSSSSHMEVIGKKQCYQAEMVVLAAHNSVADLGVFSEDCLVPYADQWQKFQVAWQAACPLDPGTVFSTQHGYFWGVLIDEQYLCVGGGRFLRPLAGIGASVAVFENRISQMMKREVEHCFRQIIVSSLLEGSSGIDIRPCDEIPLIGPKYGEPRLLVATGFMGFGISWGFWAGQKIAELVDRGKAPELPRCLWPERLRSLEN